MLQRVLVAALRFIASQKRRGNLEPSALTSVLVVELGRLGDALVMLPSLVRLQGFFPQASISVLVDQRYVPLFRSFDTTFEFIGIRNATGVLGVLRAFLVTRRKPVDLAISMSTPRRNAVVTLLSNSRFKAGYLSNVDSLAPFLQSTPVEAFGVSLPSHVRYSRENIYERPAKICAMLGMGTDAQHRPLTLKQEACEPVLARLKEAGKIPGRRYVVIHPVAGWVYRNWSPIRFIALANRIIGELASDVVISCETHECENIRRLLSPGSPIRVMGSSDVLDAAVLIKNASLIIGNDSGPLHLAAALNVKAIGLFGPASPELTAPRNDRGRYLYKRVECSPCDQRKCLRPDHPCMDLHEIDDVFACVASELRSPVTDESMATHA